MGPTDKAKLTSAGPAPMPHKMFAPMKLLYVVASAFQMLLAKQIAVDKIKTGRLPKDVWRGVL